MKKTVIILPILLVACSLVLLLYVSLTPPEPIHYPTVIEVPDEEGEVVITVASAVEDRRRPRQAPGDAPPDGEDTGLTADGRPLPPDRSRPDGEPAGTLTGDRTETEYAPNGVRTETEY